MYYFIAVIAIILLDQLIKYFVVNNMFLYQSIPVIENVFHFTYIHNTGAAFSLMAGFRGFLILLPFLMVVGVVAYMIVKRKNGHPLMMASLAMIAGGGIANLIDRVFLGYVVDYLDFRVFPIFNLADICVCVGCGLLILYMLLFDGKENVKGNDL